MYTWVANHVGDLHRGFSELRRGDPNVKRHSYNLSSSFNHTTLSAAGVQCWSISKTNCSRIKVQNVSKHSFFDINVLFVGQSSVSKLDGSVITRCPFRLELLDTQLLLITITLLAGLSQLAS